MQRASEGTITTSCIILSNPWYFLIEMKSNTNKKSAPVSSAIRMPTSSSALSASLFLLLYLANADWTRIVQTFSFHYLPMAGKEPKKELENISRQLGTAMKIHSIRTLRKYQQSTIRICYKMLFALSKSTLPTKLHHFVRIVLPIPMLTSSFLLSLRRSSLVFFANFASTQ